MFRRPRPSSSRSQRTFSPLRLTCLEDRLAPAVATWDGGGTDNLWSTAANWVGDVAPQPPSDLVFPANTARMANVNDFPAGTLFHSIRLDDPRSDITGNGITLAGGIVAFGPNGSNQTSSHFGLD